MRPLVLPLLLLLVLAGGCARAGGEAFQPTLNEPLPLEAGRTLGQSLNPAGSAVAGVDLQVATYDAPADPEGILTVTLVDPVSGDVLDTAQVGGDAMADASWVRADFGTPVAVGDVVVVEASWDGDTPLALWANVPPAGPAVEVVNDPYPDGQLVRDGRPSDGDLAFRVVGAGGVGAGAGQLAEVVRSTGARLADQPAFAVLWGLAVVGAAALAVVGLRARG